MEERVFSRFQSVMDIPPEMSRAEIIYNDTPGWDSVAHMTLIGTLEDEFDCMLEMDDIIDMSSFEMAVVIMKKYV
jgi:acyl carrier protein